MSKEEKDSDPFDWIDSTPCGGVDYPDCPTNYDQPEYSGGGGGGGPVSDSGNGGNQSGGGGGDSGGDGGDSGGNEGTTQT